MSSEPNSASKQYSAVKDRTESLTYNERFYVGPDPIDPNQDLSEVIASPVTSDFKLSHTQIAKLE